MCYGCWLEEGSPVVITDIVLKSVPLIRETDECGAMHCVISDWNLDDSALDLCEGWETATDDEKALCRLMKQMSLPERFTAMALADGCIDETGKDLWKK